MVSALDSGSSIALTVVFLGQALYSHNAGLSEDYNQLNDIIVNTSIFLTWFFSPLDIPQCCGQLLGFVQSFSEYLQSNKTVGNDAECLSVLSQAIQSYILVAPNGEEIVQHLDFKFMLTLIR